MIFGMRCVGLSRAISCTNSPAAVVTVSRVRSHKPLSTPAMVHVLDTGHAINFEEPDNFVGLVAAFIEDGGGSSVAGPPSDATAQLTP